MMLKNNKDYQHLLLMVFVLTKGLRRMGIFCHHPERRLIVMVNLVDVLVDPLVMEEAVEEIVPCVLHHQAHHTPAK